MDRQFVPRVARWVMALFLWLPCVAQDKQSKPSDPPKSVAIDDENLLLSIEAQCEVLRKAGKLKTARELLAAKPPDALPRLALAPTSSASRTTVELRRLLARSVVLVGEHYRCEECDAWHSSASTGFVVASGCVATCLHVLQVEASEDGHEPYMFVADYDGAVHPIDAVLARDEAYDLAALQCSIEAPALPIEDGAAEPGQRVYCLSNPDHMFGTFSEGLIARTYVVRGPAPGTVEPPQDDVPVEHDLAKAIASKAGFGPRPFLQVSCDFGGGSSGAPIVDERGNVIGIAQSTATVAADPEAEQLEVQMVARTASPAAALLALLRRQ